MSTIDARAISCAARSQTSSSGSRSLVWILIAAFRANVMVVAALTGRPDTALQEEIHHEPIRARIPAEPG
jgi:hypothetical protein